MHIWIDAEPVARSPRLFGFSTLERILRSIKKSCDPRTVVVVSGLAETSVDARYTRLNDQGSTSERLAAYLRSTDEPVLALDGGAVIDSRLVHLMMQSQDPACFLGASGEKASAVVRLSDPDDLPQQAASLRDIADAMLAKGAIREVMPDELPDFVVNLRRNVPFTLERLKDEKDRDAFEKRLFHLNYKGSTDFMTKWVYPPLVWPLVKLCIRFGITPNMVTIVSIILAFLAVPLFAYEYWISGLAAAYAMTVLDSVDGKLARLTLTDSPIGNILDHGLDIVHPPFWYIGWAMGLSAGGSDAPLYNATALLIFFYIADRLALKTAKKRFKRGLHAVTPLDGFVRTWIARRNVNLVIFTLGLLFGLGTAAFMFIVLWQGLTFGWHAMRTIWLFPKARHENYLT